MFRIIWLPLIPAITECDESNVNNKHIELKLNMVNHARRSGLENQLWYIYVNTNNMTGL
jgi:hypothetical protein